MQESQGNEDTSPDQADIDLANQLDVNFDVRRFVACTLC